MRPDYRHHGRPLKSAASLPKSPEFSSRQMCVTEDRTRPVGVSVGSSRGRTVKDYIDMLKNLF